MTTTTFSSLHPDIIESHILPYLDGPSLASSACCSAVLRRISSHRRLWSHLCHSTWPSTTASPVICHVVDIEPRHFFSHAYSINRTFPSIMIPSSSSSSHSSALPSELISAVDIFYRDNNNLIFSRVQSTETETSWFKCSPFRIDMVDPKDVILTQIKLKNNKNEINDSVVQDFKEHMKLSWLMIDAKGRRVINLSSQEPVSVQRHWLTGEIQLKYAVIISRVQCGVVVKLGCGDQNDVVTVREVSLEMEDVDGTHLNGRDSLRILDVALRDKTGKGGKNRAVECKEVYDKFLEMRIERKEKKERTEWVLDMLCVAFGVVFGFVAFVWFVFMRR